MSDLDEIVALARATNTRSGKLLARSTNLVADARATATPRELDRIDRAAWHAVSVQARAANPKLAPQRRVEVPDAIEIGKSRNRFEPIGPYCASTYVSIAATCPESCPFRDNGCFAQAGAMHLTMGARDRAGRRTTGLEVTLAEAAKLDALWVRGVPQDGAKGGRDLRLHVGGDTSCERGARALGAAVARLRVRGLGDAWSYTHRWREIPREAFGPIAVLASCETPADAVEALDRGYAPALTVEDFAARRAFPVAPGVKAIPCPFEAEADTTCVKCRLCFDDARLRQAGRAIAFRAHGADAAKAKTRLRVLNGRL